MEFVEILEILFIGGFVAFGAFIALVWMSAFVIDGLDWWEARTGRTTDSGADTRSLGRVVVAESADEATELQQMPSIRLPAPIRRQVELGRLHSADEARERMRAEFVAGSSLARSATPG